MKASPFDHRGSFETKMFGWEGPLDAEQTAQIAAAKQVIYRGFKHAVAAGVPKEKAATLVDEGCGAAILPALVPLVLTAAWVYWLGVVQIGGV
jgi:hypothetical protein